MLRTAALLAAGLSLVAATTAEACSCVAYPTRAEADREGEKIYRAADLIVEATVGKASASHAAMCPTGGAKPRPVDIGRSITANHPIAIHRVLKGKPPTAPVLAGATTTVDAEGCSIIVSSCDGGVQPGVRTILVLHRATDGRFRPISVCGLMTLRDSRRGRSVFGAT